MSSPSRHALLENRERVFVTPAVLRTTHILLDLMQCLFVKDPSNPLNRLGDFLISMVDTETHAQDPSGQDLLPSCGECGQQAAFSRQLHRDPPQRQTVSCLGVTSFQGELCLVTVVWGYKGLAILARPGTTLKATFIPELPARLIQALLGLPDGLTSPSFHSYFLPLPS